MLESNKNFPGKAFHSVIDRLAKMGKIEIGRTTWTMQLE